MLSNTTKYALRALVYIALNSEDGKKIGLKSISKDLDIPTPFLAKILQQMARQNILLSTKGPGGGFLLKNKPENTALIEVINLFDNQDLFELCYISNQKCTEIHTHCLLHTQVTEIRSKIREVFTNTTLKDLIDNAEKLGEGNYFI
jgi:Rrf2 family protein